MKEVHTFEELEARLGSAQGLADLVVQDVNVAGLEDRLGKAPVQGTVFLGCNIAPELVAKLHSGGALVFPDIPTLPFNPYRNALYSPEELFSGFVPGDPCSYCKTLDAVVYRHWETTGRSAPPNLLEALARRLHDHAITDATIDFLAAIKSTCRGRVAIMGGHSMLRSDAEFLDVCRISKELSEAGYLLLSGGGPGAMEATHVGASLAHRGDQELRETVSALAKAPHYRDRDWLSQGLQVKATLESAGTLGSSLAIPTWLYGHEPPTPFARHIAKYFSNSVREEGLVTLASEGIIFAPGSAGTIQEVFQDATQNHYATTGVVSPMVFLGVEFWTQTKPVFPLLEQLAQGEDYAQLLTVVDGVDAAVDFIKSHPPVAGGAGDWSFCRAHCDENS